MAADYTWSFTTGAAPDVTPPAGSATSPTSNETGVAINSAINATFSEVMDANSITTATFTLSDGINAVTGTVNYTGTTATFTPSSTLLYDTLYTATITTGVKDSAGNGMTDDYTWSFTTGAAPDVTPPEVSATSPAGNETGVAINSAINATFSEVMDANMITTATFTLRDGTNAVAGTVNYTGTTATFTPSSTLLYDTLYTATITTGVKDSAGNGMTADYTWSFTTGAAPDVTPPAVSATSPAGNETGVAINSAINATFSEVMDANTITTATFTLSDGANAVTGTVNYTGTTATFTPSSTLLYDTLYTATITTGVKDSAGNAMAANYIWSFTTGAAPDVTPPAVSATSPAGNETNVAINSAINATFSEVMDANTITTATFTLSDGINAVTGTVNYTGTTATFTPLSNLAYATGYTATITTGVKDSAGNGMAADYTWSFTTGAAPDVTPPEEIGRASCRERV